MCYLFFYRNLIFTHFLLHLHLSVLIVNYTKMNNMDLQLNTMLQGGKYIIEKKLGNGGFGITYLGTQIGLGRKVAIKEFYMSDYCSRDATTNVVTVTGGDEKVSYFRRKFVEEARRIAELEHPYVVSVIDVFEENCTAYYVMKYIDGESLKEFSSRRRADGNPLSEYEVRCLMNDVLDALEYVHSRGLIHLDLKPGNIMVDSRGHCHLIDFGTSRHLIDENGNSVLPSTSTVLPFTVGYAPPEQINYALDSLSPATDIFAIGAIYYALLSGNSPAEIKKYTFPTMSDSMRCAINEAMRLDCDERVQSVADFRTLLNGDNVVSGGEDTKINYDITGEGHKIDKCEKAIANPAASAPKYSKIVLGLCFCCLIAVACFYWGNLKSEQTLKDVDLPSTSGVVNGHEWVDLGLSVKWATCNVGANSPSDYGSYFAWGEIRTKAEYTSTNSKTEGKDFTHHINGYNMYDAARANWGGDWRLPTEGEVEELRNQCVWTWTSENGHYGYRVDGINGAHIFLPAAGYFSGSICKGRGSRGDYWAGTMDRGANIEASSLSFEDGDIGDDTWYSRCYGFTIRPVIK